MKNTKENRLYTIAVENAIPLSKKRSPWVFFTPSAITINK